MQFRNLINFRSAGIVASLAILSGNANANLIVNGDFENGNSGFASAYAYNPLSLLPAAVFAVVDDPSSLHGGATSYGDHTSGTGLMMAINGAGAAGTIVWSQTISVLANTEYDFAAWISSWHPANPAALNFEINDSLIGTLDAPSTTGIWDLAFATWNSGGATEAVISITNSNLAAFGNDFALDDIYFGETIFSNPDPDPNPTPVPEPASMLLLTLGLAGFGLQTRTARRIKRGQRAR